MRCLKTSAYEVKKCEMRYCDLAWASTDLLTSLSLGKLPILNWLSVAPGFPPLADGWGMGAGLAAGDGTG